MKRHRWLLCLSASALAVLAPSALVAQPAAGNAPAACIKIDPDRVVGEVHPYVFGNFAEHLGRWIYGGIFEEGSPLSDADGSRKDVMEPAKGLGVTILRWPGGNFSSGYNWKDGIGPRDQRPPRLEMAWGTVQSNRFGTVALPLYVILGPDGKERGRLTGTITMDLFLEFLRRNRE